jgi:transposase InsO family protein
MKDVYDVAGISKQAAHQYRSRSLQRATIAYQFFEQADKIRKEHPGAGCRTMAKDLRCKGWGRDKIEQLLLSNGYRLQYPVNYVRTTYSQTDVYYPNLIEGLELTEINRVVQTDITYYRAGEKFYYVVFLIDVYSRRIVGYAVNKTLEAEGNIKALRMLLETRKGDDLSKVIHHSDRGSQYIDQQYRQILKDNGISLSMCKAAWENAYSERINRTIKEEYLDKWIIKDFETLSRSVARAVRHYNNKRKHTGLRNKSPVQFEKELENISEAQRPKEKIYQHLERYSEKEKKEEKIVWDLFVK